MNIFDLVSAPVIATYWTENTSNRIPYLGEALWPADKRLGLDLAWIKGASGLPVSLTASAFDTKAPLRDRIGFDKIETEMPFFREAARIGEKDRQELNKVMASNNMDMIKPIIKSIYDDVSGLIDGADVVAERLRMQLLTTGKISIVSSGIEYKYDYKFPAAHKKTLTDAAQKWSATETATPVQDIQEILDKVEEDTGDRPNKLVMTRKTWNYLMANKSIRLDLDPIGGTNRIMTDGMLQEYLSTKLGIKVIVYNKKFLAKQGGTAEQFFPDNLVAFLPNSTLGKTWFGTTPEESDLMGGNTDAQVQILKNGIALTSYKEPHPVNVLNVVSMIALPSYEQIEKVFMLTVA